MAAPLGHKRFLCCTWLRGKHATDVSVSKSVGAIATWRAIAGRSNMRKAADLAAFEDDKLSSKRADFHRACSHHLRKPVLQTKADNQCRMMGECITHCCCVGSRVGSSNTSTSQVGPTTRARLESSSRQGKCMTPKDCEDTQGQCKERLRSVSLDVLRRGLLDTFRWVRLEDAERAVSFLWYNGKFAPLKSGPAICFTGTHKSLEKNLEKSLKMRQGGVLNLGVNDPKHEAMRMRTFHWDVSYAHSPFQSVALEETMFKISGPYIHHMPWSLEYCTQSGIWEKLVGKMGSPAGKHDDRYGRSGRMTFVVTANVAGMIELRFARIEDKFCPAKWCNDIGNKIKDMQGKHAFLNRAQDIVTWAGEVWLQVTPKAMTRCSENFKRPSLLNRCLKQQVAKGEVVVIFNNDSGTYKVSDDIEIRIAVQKLLLQALGPKANVQVCGGPFYSGEGGPPCPLQSALYSTPKNEKPLSRLSTTRKSLRRVSKGVF